MNILSPHLQMQRIGNDESRQLAGRTTDDERETRQADSEQEAAEHLAQQRLRRRRQERPRCD